MTGEYPVTVRYPAGLQEDYIVRIPLERFGITKFLSHGSVPSDRLRLVSGASFFVLILVRLGEKLDPEIMMGEPCVKGTRIPVYVLVA